MLLRNMNKALYFLCSFLLFLVVGLSMLSLYYKGRMERAVDARIQAEAARDTALKAKNDLQVALSEQEKATLEAQQKQKVIYRTVKQEVSQNEDSRSWFNSAVPDGMRRLLKDSAGK